MALDGIFLDLYGTITSGDRAAVHAACLQIVQDHAISIPAGDFAIRWGERFFALVDRSNHDGFKTLLHCEHESLDETLAECGLFNIDTAPYVNVLEDYWQAPPVHDEVHDVLARLQLPICLVTNADTLAAHGAMTTNRLRFAHVVTSEEARCYKPDAGIFRFALRRTGWRADRVLHVGDSLHSDIKGAKAAGLRSAWICREDRIHDIGTVEPDHRLRTLHDLFDLLNTLAIKPATV